MKKTDIYNILTVILPVKNYSSRKEWEGTCWQKILKSRELLQFLISTDEQHNLVMRAAALNGIVSDKSYRVISKEFFVSLQTINIVKRAMKDGGYRSYNKTRRGEKKNGHEIISKPIKHTSHKRTVRTKFGTIHPNY